MQIEALVIEGNEGLPHVNFQQGHLALSGNSFPEDAIQFFTPLINWIDRYAESEYVQSSENQTHFTCQVGYFNTGSRPFMLTIVKQINELARKGHPVKFQWYYEGEPEDLLEDDDLNFDELIDDFVLDVDFIPVKGK